MKKILTIIFALFSFNVSANSHYIICTVESKYRGLAQTKVVSLPYAGEQSTFLDVENYSIEISKTATEKTFNLSIHKNDYMVYDDVIYPDQVKSYKNEDLGVTVKCRSENYEE